MIIEEFLTNGKTDRIDYIYTNFGGNTIKIEGIKDLLQLNSDCISVKLKKGELNIKGENLSIEELGKSTITICGKIISIEN